MINDVDVHIKKLAGFRERHRKLRNSFNSKKKPDNRLKNEMDAIRYTCKMYMKRSNLFRHLTYGGTTPQEIAEYNDFDSISDFDEILEGVITKLKFK